MTIWGDDNAPSARSEGIGYVALVILMLVFWLALSALDRELREDATGDPIAAVETER